MKFLTFVSLTSLILPSLGMITGQLHIQDEGNKDEILSYSSHKIAPLYSSIDAEEISDNYIVVFKDNVNIMNSSKHTTWLLNLLQTSNGKESEEKIKHVFDLHSHFRGYSGKFSQETIEKIRTSDEVAYVEKDQIVHALDVDTDAPWGLSRIAHRTKPDTEEEYKKYTYNEAAGRNVTVYVIDTGVNVNHVDFEGRAIWGATIPEDDEDIDGNGHGTHVAGTVAGKKYGVAKKANIVAVKVLRSNGSGSMSDVIKGIEFAVEHHKQRVEEAEKINEKLGDDSDEPKVIVKSAANMSLGGGRSRALDRVVDAAVKAGIQFAVAAGNDGLDACNYSPAAAKNAITVGATTMDDRMAWFSNHGSCVDVFAPGHYITSAWIGSNVSTNTISGTSMASPHVAGLIALLLSMPEHENKTPEEIKQVIIDMSTPNVIKGLPFWTESANRLIYSNPPKEE